MILLEAKLDIEPIIARYRALPGQLQAGLEAGFNRIGIEAARIARREAPKLQSTLTNSIHWRRPDAGTVEVVAGSRYAEYVHEGTGPAAGKAAYLPPAERLYEYVKARAGVSFRNTRRGGAARGRQYDEIRDRAWALARYIQRHGTKPNPFMERTREVMEKRAPEILERELARVAEEASS